MACKGGSIPATGNAEPHIEILSTDHNELILIDMRNEGIKPKAKAPKPSELATCRMVSRTMLHTPPNRGKCSTLKI